MTSDALQLTVREGSYRMMCMMKGICSSRLCSACNTIKLIDPSSNAAWQDCCLFARCMDTHSSQICWFH